MRAPNCPTGWSGQEYQPVSQLEGSRAHTRGPEHFCLPPRPQPHMPLQASHGHQQYADQMGVQAHGRGMRLSSERRVKLPSKDHLLPWPPAQPQHGLTWGPETKPRI